MFGPSIPFRWHSYLSFVLYFFLPFLLPVIKMVQHAAALWEALVLSGFISALTPSAIFACLSISRPAIVLCYRISCPLHSFFPPSSSSPSCLCVIFFFPSLTRAHNSPFFFPPSHPSLFYTIYIHNRQSISHSLFNLLWSSYRCLCLSF